MNSLERLLDDMLKAGWDMEPASNGNNIRAKSPDGQKIIYLTSLNTHRRGVEHARKEFTSWQRATLRRGPLVDEAVRRIDTMVHKDDPPPEEPKRRRKKEPEVTGPVKYAPEDHDYPRPKPGPPPQRSRPIPPEEQVSSQNGHQPPSDDSLEKVKEDLLAISSLVEKELKAIAYRVELIAQRTGDIKDFKDKLKELLS